MPSLLDLLGQTWPARMAKGAWEAAKLPGDVYAGRADPLSDESIGRAADLAGTVMGGTAFSAPKGALGAGPVAPRTRIGGKVYEESGAPYPQFAERYPETGPPTLVTDKKTGKEFLQKTLTPEAEQFQKTRAQIGDEMKQGYEPYFDPAKRFDVDPSNYPGRNVDTLTVMPKKQATLDEYLKTIDAPETREKLRAAFARGEELGGADNWYAMGQLEQAYIKELGEKAGRKAYLDEFAVPMASTTSGNNPTTNFLMGQYLEHVRKLGKPMPAGGTELPVTVGGRRSAMNIRDYNAMRQGGGYDYLSADQPKMHNFARSFIGDLDRAVMDEQMAGGMLSHADPKFVDRARKQGFGLLERPVHEEAAAAGVKPGNYQDVAWAGFKNESGGPMIGVVNDAIERTHRLTGMPRDEIVRRGLIRKEIPIYGLGGAVAAPSLLDILSPQAGGNSNPNPSGPRPR